MGRRGPAPLPTKILQLRGTYRADRHGTPDTEPQFAPLTTLPPAPGFLDDVGHYEWQRVGLELMAKQLLTEIDLAAFTLYCVSVARVVACEKVLSKVGMTMVTERGERARPEVLISRQAGAEVRRFCQEFGLTPSARTRVHAPSPVKRTGKSAWDDVG